MIARYGLLVAALAFPTVAWAQTAADSSAIRATAAGVSTRSICRASGVLSASELDSRLRIPRFLV